MQAAMKAKHSTMMMAAMSSATDADGAQKLICADTFCATEMPAVNTWLG